VGATTPSTVAATTGTFSGQITSTIDGAKYLSRTGTSLNQQFQEVGNTGGNYQLGVERSTGGALVVGGSPYATVLTTTGATNIEFGVNLQKVGTFSSTGLAVTGALSSTTGANFATSSGFVGFGRTSPICLIDGKVAASATNVLGFNLSNDVNTNLEILLKNDVTTINAGGTGTLVFATESTVTERARITSTGLAVTGALSATGALAIGNTVNTVSPTSPNRTVTIVINGTTYYLAAKTTND
jgi:hypothetical protein